MDRRNFFRKALHDSSKKVVEHVDAKANQRASHWIRPPFALDELEFLLACTRCGECETACPHDVIFLLSTRLGAQVAATPALDLLNKGCQLCKDWPCVTVCEPKALLLPEMEEDKAVWPTLAKVWINEKACLPFSGPECGACAGSCPVPGALSWDQTRPVINEELCTGCSLCREICIVDPKAIEVKSLHNTKDSI